MNTFQKFVAKYSVYLEELRHIVVRIAKIFAIAFVFGFGITSPAIKFFMSHVHMEGVTIVTTSPFQLIDLAMSAGFFLGCVVIVPIFIYYLYRFIRPGLLPRERRVFMLSLPVSLGLFILGFLYSCVMLYFAVNLVAQVNVSLGVVNYWDIGLFVSQMVLTSSLLGVLFVYPIIITFLIKLRLLTVEFLVSKRRHAIVGIFVLVSLLPPTDGLSLILMSAPLVLIFELTILCNRKNRRV